MLRPIAESLVRMHCFILRLVPAVTLEGDLGWTVNGKSCHAVSYKERRGLLANPLECAAVDLLQICHICQHLVA